jgi:lysozyme
LTDQLFDISHWNQDANFLSAKQVGEDGVYLKATEGDGYVDPTFASRWVSARAAGLKRGAYLFFNPTQSAEAQVALFLRTLGSDKGELKAALDWEDAKGLTVGEAVAAVGHVAALLTAALGYKPLLYTYRAFAGEGFCAGLESFPLWLADYSGSEHVPLPWTTAVLWQTGQAHVSGISAGDGSGVDVDTIADIRAIMVTPDVTPAKPSAAASPALKLGSKGQKVKDVQHALNLCGNSITVDGVFGPETDKILRVFQAHRSIKVTGTTDAATWSALRAVAHAAA